MSPKDLLQAFKIRKKVLEEDLQVLKLQEAREGFAPRSAQQLFGLGMTMLQAELGWLEEEIDILQSREG